MPSFFAVPSIICVSSCPARPTNGMPCASSSAPGPFADEDQRGLLVAHPKHDLVAALVQAAAAAIADVFDDLEQRVASGEGRQFHGGCRLAGAAALRQSCRASRRYRS